MRVLILANSTSGLYSFRRELLERLIADGHDVFFDTPVDRRVDDVQALGAIHIPCDSLTRHGTNPLMEMRLLQHYRSVLKVTQPDIVFTYTIKPNVWGGIACSMTDTPYVANITGLGTAVESGGVLQTLTLLLYRLGLRKAQKVFFQNAKNRDFLLAHDAVHGSYELLPGSGVNLARYVPLPYPKGDTVDFVFIARIMRQKGIEQYLDAADLITSKHPEARFHVCGEREPEYKGRLDDCMKRGTVIYHGRVDDIAAIHTFCSCTVHPTYYPEGMSNVLLESCACARPIIATDRPGCREIVDDGINGYLVHERDSLDLVEKIEKFLLLDVDTRRQMGVEGRCKVEREFDRQTVVEKYLHEIENVGK